ncbi:Uncharacterised protein [Vibrio cholerae]|nr:Uncharacterised protein [Vibrio cholerae]
MFFEFTAERTTVRVTFAPPFAASRINKKIKSWNRC